MPSRRRQLSLRGMSVGVVAFLMVLVVWPAVLALFFLVLLHQTAIKLFVSFVSLKAKIMKFLATIRAAQSSQKDPNLNLVYYLICSGSITLDQLRSQFQNQVLDFKDKWWKKPYSRLRCTWRSFMGVTFWEMESNFDLQKHIKHFNVDDLVLPSPRRVEDIVKISGQLVVKSYVEGTSPWELLLLQNVIRNEGTFASVVILRIHPALTDGHSAMGLIHRLFGMSPPTPLARGPTILSTKQYFENSYIAIKAPYDLGPFMIDSGDELDPLNCPTSGGEIVTLCSEQVLWKDVKRIMKKFGLGWNGVVYSFTAGLVLKLIEDFEKNSPMNVEKNGTYPWSFRPGELSIHFWAQNSTWQPAFDLGAAYSSSMGWGFKASNVFGLLQHIPRASVCLQSLLPLWLLKRIVKVRSTWGFSHFPRPLEELSAPGPGRLLDIIPCSGIGHTGSLAVLVSKAGQLRIVLTVDKRILTGFSANFAKYVNRGLHELLAD